MPRHTGLAWPKSDMSKSTFGFMAPVDHRRREMTFRRHSAGTGADNSNHLCISRGCRDEE